MTLLFEDPLLSIDLPAQWQLRRVAEGGLLVFTDSVRQFSVSVIRFEQAPKELRTTITRLYEARVSAERHALSARDVLIVEPVEVVGARYSAFFSGGERATGRVFVARLSAGTLGFVLTYLESLSDSFDDVLAMAIDMLPGVTTRVGGLGS